MPLTFATLVTVPAALAQLVVYDNSVNDLTGRFNPGTVEVGDQIVLQGSSPTDVPTKFSFEYYQVNGANAAGSGGLAEITFYANDGALYNGYATPGTVLWNSGTFSIGGTTRATMEFGASDLASFVGPLPSTLTWSIKFSGLTTGERAGLDLYSPAVVGQNYVDYWYNHPVDGWQLLEFPGGVPDISFAAVMEVPEPSEFAVALGLGALAFGVFRRRKAA